MKKIWGFVMVAVLLLYGCSAPQGSESLVAVSGSDTQEGSSNDKKTEAREPNEPPAAPFTQTAQGYPVVTVGEGETAKRYLLLDQMEEIVYAPLSTEEYSLPQLYAEHPAPQIIDGLQMINPYATLYLNGQTLVVDHGDHKKEFDLYDIITGEDYQTTNAFHPRRVWFYQEDGSITMFFNQGDVQARGGDIHVVKFDLANDEVAAYRKIESQELVHVLLHQGDFYLLCATSQVGDLRVNVVNALSQQELSLRREGAPIPLSDGWKDAELAVREDAVYIHYQNWQTKGWMWYEVDESPFPTIDQMNTPVLIDQIGSGIWFDDKQNPYAAIKIRNGDVSIVWYGKSNFSSNPPIYNTVLTISKDGETVKRYLSTAAAGGYVQSDAAWIFHFAMYRVVYQTEQAIYLFCEGIQGYDLPDASVAYIAKLDLNTLDFVDFLDLGWNSILEVSKQEDAFFILLATPHSGFLSLKKISVDGLDVLESWKEPDVSMLKQAGFQFHIK